MPSICALEVANHLTLIQTFSLKGEGTGAYIPGKSDYEKAVQEAARPVDSRHALAPESPVGMMRSMGQAQEETWQIRN